MNNNGNNKWIKENELHYKLRKDQIRLMRKYFIQEINLSNERKRRSTTFGDVTGIWFNEAKHMRSRNGM